MAAVWPATVNQLEWPFILFKRAKPPKLIWKHTLNLQKKKKKLKIAGETSLKQQKIFLGEKMKMNIICGQKYKSIISF